MAFLPDRPQAHDLVSLAQFALEQEVKRHIEEDIVRRYVADFEATLRSHLRSELEKYTFESIEGYRDMLNIRDELRVRIKFDENRTTQQD